MKVNILRVYRVRPLLRPKHTVCYKDVKVVLRNNRYYSSNNIINRISNNINRERYQRLRLAQVNAILYLFSTNSKKKNTHTCLHISRRNHRASFIILLIFIYTIFHQNYTDCVHTRTFKNCTRLSSCLSVFLSL